MIYKALFLFVLFIANVIQTITGFAGNLLAMPPSMNLVGIETAKSVINIFTLIACLYISIKNRKFIQWRILTKMLVLMLLGMWIGIWLFELIPLELLLTLYGIMIILIGLKKLFIHKEFQLPEFVMVLLIIMAGVIHGMFLSGGALLVVYAVSVLKDKNEFRATIAPVWVILDGVLIFSHYQLGYYTKENMILIVLSMIPLILSIIVGNFLYKKIKQETFLKITYILLLVAGVSVIL